MKTFRVISLKLGVFASVVSLMQGQGAGQSMASPAAAVAASSQFQVEYSRTGRKTAPAISDTNDLWLVKAPAEAPAQKPMLLRRIVGAEAAALSERVKAIHALGNNLSGDEVAALCAFLISTPAAGATDLDGLNWLKNDILNALREQTTPPPGLTRLLIEIYHDRAQDSVMRDYAIQHLVLWYEQGVADAPDTRENIRSVLSEAVREPGGLAGTALLGWHALSRGDPSCDSAGIDRWALRLVQSAETDNATRLTAIQVCAQRGLKAALPAIQSLVESPDCVPLRLSAVAAVRLLSASQPANVLPCAEPAQDDVARVAPRIPLRPFE